MSWLTWWKKEEKKDNQEEEKKKDSIVKYIKKKKEYQEEGENSLCDIIEYPDEGKVENVYNGSNPSRDRDTPIPNWFIDSGLDVNPDSSHPRPRDKYYAYILYKEISDITGYKITIQRMAVNEGKALYDPKTDIVYYNNMMTYQQVDGHGSGTKDIGNNYEQHIKVNIKQSTIASIGASLAFKMSTVGTTGEIYYVVVFDTEKAVNTDYFTNNTSFTVDPIIVNKFVRPNALCKYRTYSLNIVASGKFPSFFYENYLPLNNKWVYAYDDPFDRDSIPNGKVLTTDQLDDNVNRNKTHHIDSINNTWYDNTITVESTLDLLYNRDINFDYFKDVYIQKVKLSTYYRGMKLPFKYWNHGVLTDSIIEWNSDAYADVVDVKWNEAKHVLEIYFKEQEDNFLDPYINSSNNLNLSLARTNVFPIDESFAGEVMKAVTYESETGITPPVSIIVNSVTKRIDNNEFDFSFYTTSPTKVSIRYKTGSGNIFRPTNVTYSIKDINCIKNGELTISKINDVQQIVFVNNDLVYENLYLTNLKSSTTHLATNVNLIVKGNITQIYEDFPSGVDTINEAPTPGEYLESESYMNLSTITNVDLTRFGELDNTGKFIDQKIYLTKIIVNESNKTKVENSEMESTNKSAINDTYALTIVEVGEIPDEDTIVTYVTFPEDEPDTVRLELDGTEPDFLNDCVSGSILTINLDNVLWQTFYNNGNAKSELELFVKQMVIKDNSKNVEFFRNAVWYIHIKYGSQYVEYDSNSFTTYLGTLNITYTKDEEDSPIQPVTYSSNGTVKANGLQSKDSYINYIETINSINTLVIGDDNECIIGNNRITLVNEGCIPKKMYTDILPINDTNKHYVKSDGSIASSGVAQLVAINEPPKDEYLTYKSSMNLISITNPDDIIINKFGNTVNNVFKQNVFLSEIIAFRNNTIKEKFDNAHLMSRNEQVITGGLGDGEVNYAPSNIRYGNERLVNRVNPDGSRRGIQFMIDYQDTNNFIDSTEENGTKYVELFLNSNLSATLIDYLTYKNFGELSVSTLRLSNTHLVTYDGKNEPLGILRVWYYQDTEGFNPVPWIPTSCVYNVFDLKLVYGTIDTSDNKENLIPLPEKWTVESNEHHIFEKDSNENITINIPNNNNKLNSSVNIIVLNTITNQIITEIEYAKGISPNSLEYKCNLVVSGEIPQWVFKDLLPLPRKLNSSGEITSENSECLLVSINEKPFNTLDHAIGINTTGDNASSIDLTNVAERDTLNRIYDSRHSKKFYVNKVKLLERFEGKIITNNDSRALFQYYNGTAMKASTVEFDEENDWALKLPECYEGCEVSGTGLTVNFGEYLQLDNNYLMDSLKNNSTYELDLSMKIDLDLSNVIDLDLNLDTLKFIKKGDMNVHLISSNVANIIFNKNGFLEKKENINVFKQNIKNCYLIYGDYVIKNNTYLITPLSTMLNNDGYITFNSYFLTDPNVFVKNLKCTNTCQIELTFINLSKQEFNLLMSGDLTEWVNKYFKDSEKILPIILEYKDGRYKCEILPDYTGTDCFKVTSINALPAPGIGIDNSDPDDQCTLELDL